MNTIKRKTFGRAAALGCLYDARSDNVLSLSMFNQALSDEFIQTVDTHFSDYKYSFNDSFEEKFSNLNVEAELKLSVMGGLFKLEGSAKYLNEQKSSFKSVKGSLIYNIKTKRQFLSLTNEKLKHYVSSVALEMKNATHVIVGIDWGANTVASFEYENHEHSEKKIIEGSLRAHMEKISFSITGSASVKFDESDKKIGESLAIKFYGDFIPQNEDLPNSVEKTIELMKKIPKFIENSNDGKGVPIEIELIPIALVEKIFALETKIDRLLFDVNVENINRIQRELDLHLAAKQKFNDCKKEIIENCDYFPDSAIKLINETENNINIVETRFRSSLSHLLIGIRSGEKQVSEFSYLLEEFNNSGWCATGIEKFLIENKKILNQMATINNYKSMNIVYLDKTKNVEILIQQNKSKEIYILLFSEELSELNKELYKKNLDCFISLVRINSTNDENIFWIYDYKIHSDASLCPEKKICIKYYKNGIEIDADFYQNELIWSDRCLVEAVTMNYSLTKPTNTIKINLPCPNWKSKQGCSKAKCEWWCKKCQTVIEYDFNSMFYCECGGTLAHEYGFLCKDKHHPENQFVKYEQTELEKRLRGLKTNKEINILLLGESGVGKSTFINAFVNYLTYDSLEEAKRNELICLIASKFTVTDADYNEIEISIGDDDNESSKTGQSATQNAKAHVLSVENKDLLLRIIDTAGIGDTRGIDKDKENFDKLIKYISKYEYLDAICILLKPNNARLGVAFRFYIKELLSNLHKGAKDNIIFCFTNSRSTFYRPGDTMPVLRSLLKDVKETSGVEIPTSSNIFCLDNESFRFLAALHNNIEFSKREQEDFQKSWDTSVETSVKMMNYILDLPVHKVQDTVSLSDARKLITELAKPIAEVTRNIQVNIKLAEDKQIELNSNELSLRDLEKMLYLEQTDLETSQLPCPRTVCTSSNCVEVIKYNGIERQYYKTHCHVSCQLHGVATDVIDNPALQQCSAMNNGICTNCGCSWNKHMHITYELIPVKKKIIDKNTNDILHAKMSIKDKLEAFNKEINNRIEKLKEEEKIIITISAKFALFTKSNAILAFNDDIENYLNLCIREEESKQNVSNVSSTVLNSLLSTRDNYNSQKKIFDDAIKNADCSVVVNTSDITKLEEELYNMELNGAQLKNIILDIRNGKKQAEFAYENRHQIKKKKNDIKEKEKKEKKWYDFFWK